MKRGRLLVVLLLLLAGSGVQLSAQSTDAERKQFKAVQAKADKGDAEAQLELAMLYTSGIGVTADPVKATKLLRKAAEQGLARAQCLLGLNYANGVGVKEDKIEAARWLYKAAVQGLAEGQFDLAMCYLNGEGVNQDPTEAAVWFRKAADQSLPQAECELGNCYLEGVGVPKDVPEGVKWTRLAAERGFAQAQNRLGLCYSKGTGVAKDYVQAYMWLNLAAAKGDERSGDARLNMASAERFLTPEQIAEGQRLAREFKPVKALPAPQSPASPRPTNTLATAAPVLSAASGLVNVSAAEEGCEVFVDGAFVGNTPARLKLAAGAHAVVVKKAGFKDYQRKLQISDGSELTLKAVLEKK